MDDSVPDVHTPLSTDAGQQARMLEVIDDVASRLRGVCAHLSEPDFRDLMRQIAEIAVKYEAMAEAVATRTSPRPK